MRLTKWKFWATRQRRIFSPSSSKSARNSPRPRRRHRQVQGDQEGGGAGQAEQAELNQGTTLHEVTMKPSQADVVKMLEQFNFASYISSKKFNEEFRYTADLIKGRIVAYLLKKRVNHEVHKFSSMVTLWLPRIRRSPYLFRARAFLKFTAPTKIIRTRATPAALLSRAASRISAATSKAGANFSTRTHILHTLSWRRLIIIHTFIQRETGWHIAKKRRHRDPHHDDEGQRIDQAAASHLVLVSSDLDDGGGVASSSGYGRANLSLSETTGTASKTTSLVTGDLHDGGGVATASGDGVSSVALEGATVGQSAETTAATSLLAAGDLDDGGGVAAGSGYGRSGVTLEDTVVAETTGTTTVDDSSLESADLDRRVATTATDADETTLAQGTAATSATVVDHSALEAGDVDLCEKIKLPRESTAFSSLIFDAMLLTSPGTADQCNDQENYCGLHLGLLCFGTECAFSEISRGFYTRRIFVVLLGANSKF
ncbi:unnamed protein product [Trichogramma brassicae]|uniref:Uncharacterized protein n=1 Tax=Trichogramma brassicae TaxID=86971 RepID=A0A6H5IUY0_9HYME|nr:unnamed protein product [Trichogramma brassicae]